MKLPWKVQASPVLSIWAEFFSMLFFGRLPWKETGHQFVRIITEGWGTIFAGSFVQGVFVMWLAGFYSGMFGGTQWVGAVTTLAVFREFSVLMTGVLFSGRIGTAFTVEIGSMQISEQIAALRLMNVDPVRYLAFPRVMASFIAVPLFTAFSFGVAIFFSWILMAIFWDLSFPIFYQNAFMFVPPGVITNALLRSFIIGFTVALNAVAMGFFPGHGAKALGQAATKSIVLNLFCVLLIDLFIGMLTTAVSIGTGS